MQNWRRQTYLPGRYDLTEPCCATGHYRMLQNWHETLLQQLTPIAPRIYNIASSPAAHEGAIHITALQDVFTSKRHCTKHGLCTNYFDKQKAG